MKLQKKQRGWTAIAIGCLVFSGLAGVVFSFLPQMFQWQKVCFPLIGAIILLVQVCVIGIVLLKGQWKPAFRSDDPAAVVALSVGLLVPLFILAIALGVSMLITGRLIHEAQSLKEHQFKYEQKKNVQDQKSPLEVNRSSRQ